MIRSANQLPIARAFLREAQSSKDWLNLKGIVGRYQLDYYKSRRFLMKLVRNNYVHSRPLLGVKRPPLDFEFIADGYNRLLREYMEIVSGNAE